MQFSNDDCLRILYEESHFLVIDKPIGLFSQAAPGVDSVQVRLARQLKHRDSHPGNPFIGLPHRLDRGTSGVMLIARNQRALGKFGAQFQSRKIGKYYLAVTVGNSIDGRQHWTDYLRKVPDVPMAEICGQDDEGAKLAEMAVEPLGSDGPYSLMLVQLFTGRMHQIRIQFASRGMFIVGDTAYGGPQLIAHSAESDIVRQAVEPSTGETIESQPSRDERVEQAAMLLHAFRLECRHPQTAVPMAFTVAPPKSLWASVGVPLAQAIDGLTVRSENLLTPAGQSLAVGVAHATAVPKATDTGNS